ncbi:cytochrome b [Ideonella sp. A 288]|uniref:cytochrome b n=1 Tax=Ideonella sp. A 288 TaxID=1962181 RepID=UPI000B4AE03E|nr:cytochrome b [Ideonella sp. A 288]
MGLKPTTERYHLATVSLHWLMLALFVGVYASIELRVLFEKGTAARDAMKNLHFTLGLLMFALVLVRIAMRIRHPAPAALASIAPWQGVAAKLGHLALYALMIGMPLAGWLLLSAAGKPIPFFGLELPALLAKNKELADQIKQVHEFVGTAGYWLIGGHAAAALFHHYILRDATLQRMSPAGWLTGRSRGARRNPMEAAGSPRVG